MSLAILYETIEPHIARITLNRPDARNAWSEDMIDLMHEALSMAEGDEDIRTIILTGAGKSFCAGGDLKAMQQRTGMFQGDPVELRTRYAKGLQSITRRLDTFEKPLVAAINGAAIGAGLDLTLMCDIRIASEKAKFGSTFAAVGLIPGDGGVYLLTRTIGFARATELILTARVIDANRASELDLVHEIVPPEDVQQRALDVAREIAALPASAIRMAKTTLYRTYNHQLEIALQLTAAMQGLVQHSPDHEQAVASILERISSKT